MTSTSRADRQAEKVGVVKGFKELFHDPKVAMFTVTTVVAFLLLLLYVLNTVPWGMGRGCWAQC